MNEQRRETFESLKKRWRKWELAHEAGVETIEDAADDLERLEHSLTDLRDRWREEHPEYLFRSEHHKGGWHQARKECADELTALLGDEP